jgi:hypothetical protein
LRRTHHFFAAVVLEIFPQSRFDAIKNQTLVMDPFVTLLETHKLMYFMPEAGKLLKLQYTKGIYGPL